MSKLKIAWLFTSDRRDGFIRLLEESIAKHGNEFEACGSDIDSDAVLFDDRSGADIFCAANPDKFCVVLIPDCERNDENSNLFHYMQVEKVKELPAIRLSVDTYLHSIVSYLKNSQSS
jgi:hypothetical protein